MRRLKKWMRCLEQLKKSKSKISESIAMLGITAGISGMLGSLILGEMKRLKKMMGTDDEIKVEVVVDALIKAMFNRIEDEKAKLELEKKYNEDKIKEQKHKIDCLEKDVVNMNNVIETVNKELDKTRTELKKWKSNYMKKVSNARKKK